MSLTGPSGTTCAAPAPNIVPRHCWRRSADNDHSCRAQQRTGEAEKPEHRHENLEPLRAIGLEIEVLVVEKALAGSEQAPASRVDAVEPGQLVQVMLDSFLGSGTTLIGAERTKFTARRALLWLPLAGESSPRLPIVSLVRTSTSQTASRAIERICIWLPCGRIRVEAPNLRRIYQCPTTRDRHIVSIDKGLTVPVCPSSEASKLLPLLLHTPSLHYHGRPASRPNIASCQRLFTRLLKPLKLASVHSAGLL